MGMRPTSVCYSHLLRPLSLRLSCKAGSRSLPKFALVAAMSTLPHQTGPPAGHPQADIAKMKSESDGSFKRKASSFRNFITQDGEFTPEKGLLFRPKLQHVSLILFLQAVTISMSHTRVVRIP